MKDIKLTEKLDLQIKDGDISIFNSSEQHQQLLLVAGKGNIREFPQAGVDLNDFLQSEGLAGLETEIRKQFKKDGMTVNKVEITAKGKIQIEANYE